MKNKGIVGENSGGIRTIVPTDAKPNGKHVLVDVSQRGGATASDGT